MVQRVVLVVLYVLIVTGPLTILVLLREHSPNDLIYEVGRSFALSGFALLAMQTLLVARLKMADRAFSMEMLSRFHKSMGVFAAILLVCHPLLLVLGGGGLSLLTSFEQEWYIWAGKFGLLLLLAHVVFSIFRRSVGLKFEQWRVAHYVLAPLILAVVFLHSWEAGDDLKIAPMRVLWVVLFLAALSAYVFHKVVKPMQLRRRPYRVHAVDRETHNVWTIELTPPEGETLYEYHPGQFHFITFYRGRDLPVEEHHWTISSSPTQRGFISSTIKESGDFTATIGLTRPGDEAVVQGPFGRFSYVLHPEDRAFVFIAGGIGITPLMAMLRHMRDTGTDAEVLLLYANRSEQDIVFREELGRMEGGDRPRLEVVHILSTAEQGWTGETGHVDRGKIERFTRGQGAGKAFYICAPPPMTVKVLEILASLGVPDSRIRMELFSL